MSTPAKERAQEALTMLHKVLKPGDTVYTVLRHVSSSGMSRRIDCYAIGKDKRPFYLSGYMEAIGIAKRHASKQGLVVPGCGMDMGFHLVYSLGCALWPKGTKKPHGTRNGEPDSTGGYALKNEWI